LIIQLETCDMLSPVALQSCFFSSSLGYGWSAWRWSQSLRKSVTGLGNFPRFRGARSTRLLGTESGAGAESCGVPALWSTWFGVDPTVIAGTGVAGYDTGCASGERE
jgi:hypothetical protein